MGDAYRIQTIGLKELHAKLAAVDRGLARELSKGLKAAAQIVVDETNRRLPNPSGPVAHSVRVTGGASGVRIVRGAPGAPWYGWLEFGSRTPISGRPRRIGPWRGSGAGPKGGRYLYPAMKDKHAQIMATLERSIATLLKSAGLT